MGDETELLEFQADEGNVQEILQQLNDLVQQLNDQLEQIGTSSESLTSLSEAFDTLDETLSTVNESLDQTLSALDDETAATQENTTALDDLTATMQELVAAVEDATTAMEDMSAQEGEAATAADEAKGSMAGAGASLTMMGMMATQAAGNFLDLGMKAADSFSLVTGMAGESQANLQKYSGQIDSLAIQFGTNMDSVGSGLYYVESAGYDLAHGGLDVLRNSMELATASGADQASVASALTAMMHSYNLTAKQSGLVTDEMALTVVRGKQSLQAYASAIGPLAAAAHNAHLSMEQMNAAEATFTQINPNVRQDTMQLRALFNATSLSMDAVAASAKKLKVPFDEAHYSSLDLEGRLQYLAQISGGTTTDAFKKLVGGTNGVSAALALMSGGGKTFEDNLKAMQHASGTTANAFKDHTQDMSFHMQQMQATMSVLAMHIVEMISPSVNAFLDKFTGLFTSMASAITTHGSQMLPIIVGLGAALAALAVGGVVAFLVAMGPVVLIVGAVALAVGALTAGVIILVQHWGQLMSVFSAHGPLSAVGNLFRGISDTVSQAFGIMNRNAQQQTLEMKLKSTQNTLQMAQENIAHIREQELEIRQRITETKDAHTKAMLEMKLKALESSEQQQKGVVSNIEKERKGIQAELDKLNPQVQLKNLQRKDETIKSHIEETQGVLQKYAEQRLEIMKKLERTKDASKRHHLEMQLQAIDAAMKQKDGVLKQLEGERKGVEKSLSNVKLQIHSEQMNPLLMILHGVGSFLQQTFMPVWKQVQTQFETQIVPAWKLLVKSFEPALPLFKLIAMAIGGILLGAVGILVGLITGVVKGLAGLFGGLATFITGFVQLITGAFTFVGGLISFFVDLFTGHFDRLGSDLARAGNGIFVMFKGMWHMIEGVFQAAWGLISGIVSGFVQGMLGFFQGLADELVGHSIVPDMVRAIVMWIASLPGKAMSAIESLMSRMKSFFTSLAANAFTWMGDFINNIVSGIENGIGKVANAAGNIAQAIASHLHFSLPEKGPLAHADEWMPDFGEMLSSGLNAQQNKVQKATYTIASTISQVGSAAPQTQGAASNNHNEMMQTMQKQNSLLAAILDALQHGGASGAMNVSIQAQQDIEYLWNLLSNKGGLSLENLQRGGGTTWR